MNGYDAEIYEMHDKPGGLCTAWKRKDYVFDGCIHWLWGSSPAFNFYRAWEELGAVQGRRIIDPEIFYRYNRLDGPPLVLYADIDKLENHMKELFPIDSATIELFCGLIRKMTKFKIPWQKAPELYNVLDIIGMLISILPIYRQFRLTSNVTMGDFAQRFKDPFLKDIFPDMLGEKDYTLMSIISTLALLQMKAGGYPVGGSFEFAKAIEQRYLNLGGKLFYKNAVEKILVENGHAVGILLSGGNKILGDYVISAADLRTTLYTMLDGKYIDPIHEELFTTVKTAPSTVQVSFGVNMDFSQYSSIVGDYYQPGKLAGHEVNWMMLRNYSMDPTTAPEGKTAVIFMGQINNYEYWEKLAADKQAYKEEKNKIADAVGEYIDTLYPGFKAAIEVVDVATPMTYVHYTGNWKGTYMTWVVTPAQAKRFGRIKKTVPGLENFWLSGMWVQSPGGLPSGVISSRHVIQMICKKDGKRFKTTIPVLD